MSENKTPVLTMAVGTPTPLYVGEVKRLTLNFSSKGWSRIDVQLPLGGGANAFMPVARFDSNAGAPVFQGDKTKVSNSIGKSREKEDGYWQIRILRPQELVSFNLDLFDFRPETAGEVEISAVGTSGTGRSEVKSQQVKENIKKLLSPPGLLSFTSDSYNVGAGTKVTLSWALKRSEGSDFDLQLFETPPDGTERGVDPQLSRQDISRSVTVERVTDFKLKLVPKGGAAQELTLRVHAYDQPGFHSYFTNEFGSPSSPRGVFGLYAHHPPRGEEVLYALLADPVLPSRAPSVSLWKTTRGFDSKGWTQVKDSSISVQEARRPGIVFDDKLWLMGGDCCGDPSSGMAGHDVFNVGYYDLINAQTKFNPLTPESENWPEYRTGHAMVKVAEDRIWLIGGCGQSGAPLDDIWVYDRYKWEKLDNEDAKKARAWPEPRCLFGVTVAADAVWLYGGFKQPGGESFNDLWRYRYDKTSNKPRWERLSTSVVHSLAKNEDVVLQYVAGMLFTLYGQMWGITTQYESRPQISDYRSWGFQFQQQAKGALDPEPLTGVREILPRVDCYHLTGSVFRGAVFCRSLTIDENSPLNKIVYYVMGKPKPQ